MHACCRNGIGLPDVSLVVVLILVVVVLVVVVILLGVPVLLAARLNLLQISSVG